MFDLTMNETGEQRRADRARALRQTPYEDTPIDEFLKGIFGKESAGGSVLDPNHEKRAAANDYGQLAGIASDAIDLPKAGLSAAGVGMLGALKRAGKSGDALAGTAEGFKLRKATDDVFNAKPMSKVSEELRASKPTAAKDPTDVLAPPRPLDEILPVPKQTQAVPSTREVQAPPKSKAPKLYQSGEKKGIYRGSAGFGGVSPQKLGAKRKEYLADAEAGAPFSKFWYDDTSSELLGLTGGKPIDADKLAHALSVTSSSTPVGTNAMYGFKGWNQDLVGDAVHTGMYPTAMSEDIAQGFAGNDVKRGLKRDPYKEGLSVAWNPNPNLRPTNDIHQLRAWGMRDPKTGKPWHKGVGAAGHRFIDEQTKWAVDALNQKARMRQEPEDWNAYRVQAAAWSPQRVKTGQADTLQDAAKHYGDFIDDHSAHITREWVPGRTTGHLQEMLRNDAQKKEYSDAMEQINTGPGGIDKLSREMGLLSAQTLPNRGVYEKDVNPGYISRIPVGKEGGGQGIDPSSHTAVTAGAGGHGLIGLQDQSAYNYLTGDASNRDVGGFRFERKMPFKDDEARALQPFDPEELAQLQARLPKGVDIPQTDPRGARALHFDDPYGEEARAFTSSMQAATGMDKKQAEALTRKSYKDDDSARAKLVNELRNVASEFHSELVPQHRSGNLFPLKEGSTYEKPDKWSAIPFINAIEGGGPKMAGGFNTAMETMAPQMLQVTEELAAKHGWTVAHFYRPMMEALATGGLPALKELVRQGIVPVAVLSTITAAFMSQGGEGEPQ